MLRSLDLFTGYGGITLALEPWCRPIAYVEIEEYAQRIIAERMADGSLPRAPIWGDVKTLNKTNLDNLLNLYNAEELLPGKLKKLTQEQVDFAVKTYQEGSSLADIAHIIGVTRQSVHALLKRRIKLRPNLRYGKENHFFRGGKISDDSAQNVMEKAIERGDLVNPGVCSSCGYMGCFADGRTAIQGHHDDYNKPLDVRWLCQRCHHEWHKHNQAVPAQKKGGPIETQVDIIVGGFP